MFVGNHYGRNAVRLNLKLPETKLDFTRGKSVVQQDPGIARLNQRGIAATAAAERSKLHLQD
jgi:hypothetical protein